jgi:hypothetical protein
MRSIKRQNEVKEKHLHFFTVKFSFSLKRAVFPVRNSKATAAIAVQQNPFNGVKIWMNVYYWWMNV